MELDYKVFQVNCEHCQWKKIATKIEDLNLYELPVSKLQKTPAYLDPDTKKMVKSQWKDQKIKFRCPNCGMAMVGKWVLDHQRIVKETTILNEKEAERQKLIQSLLERDKTYAKNRHYRYQDSPQGPEIQGEPPAGTPG